MKKRGISLITLIIIIVITIIIATVIIISMNNSGVFDKSKKARFYNDFRTVEEAVTLYRINEYTNNLTYNIFPLKGMLTNEDKEEIKKNNKTLESDINLKSGNITNAELGWIDSEKIGINLSKSKKKRGYIIDINSGQIYDYVGEYFENKRWHTLEDGFSDNSKSIEDVLIGNIRLILEYPEGSTEKMWRLGNSGELRSDESLQWKYYTDPIVIPIFRVQDVWIKYVLNGKEVIKPPEGKLIVDIQATPTSKNSEEVNVNIKYEEGTTKEYKIGNGDWKEYTGEFTVTENVVIYARSTKKDIVKDKFGNVILTRDIEGKDTYFVSNIGIDEEDDKLIAPVIERLNAVNSDEVARVKIIYPEGAIKSIYKLDYQEEIEYSSEVSIKKFGTTVIAYYYNEDEKRSESAILVIDEENKNQPSKHKQLDPKDMQNIENPNNPKSPLNPNNPSNPESLMNPNNPKSPLNENNPYNPSNPNSPYNKDNPQNPINTNNPNEPIEKSENIQEEKQPEEEEIEILEKEKYFLLKLPYPEDSFSQEYKFVETDVWKEYKKQGILLIKKDYKEEVLKNIQENGVLIIELESGEKEKFSGDWYIIETSVNDLVSDIYMRWEKLKDDEKQELPNIAEEGEKGTPLEKNSTINGNDASYSNPIIPAAFYPVNTPDANWERREWNNGLVIKDAEENEYVWVPVENINDFKRRDFNKGENLNSEYREDITDEQEEKIIYSVKKYGGFYIARYEASSTSKKSSSVLSSKRGLKVLKGNSYNSFLNYLNRLIKSSPEYTSSYPIIVTGTMWDATISWMEKSDINITDSRSWGNYINSIEPANLNEYGKLATTDYSANWKIKNIYNMAGNVWEWTMEGNNDNKVLRGGDYNSQGEVYSVASRSSYSRTSSGETKKVLGTRLAMYIKTEKDYEEKNAVENCVEYAFSENKTINGNEYSSKNPLIPKGFCPVETKDASWILDSEGNPSGWNNGLVVRDSKGNEYVWVPRGYMSYSTTDDWLVSDYGGEYDKYKDLEANNTTMINKVYKYGGFYIARYEISEVNGVLQSKRGYDNNSDSFTEARQRSMTYAKDNGYETLYSTLTTGSMWDTIVYWIQSSKINIRDSRSYGNYKDSVYPANELYHGNEKLTGYSEHWKVKNIYDMAGNSAEWTTEEIKLKRGSEWYYVKRGGEKSITYRGYDHLNNSWISSSYRIALYFE